MQRFGEKLRLLRTRHQMTVRDLAAALGYANNGYISLMENGKRRPSLEVVLRVAQLFHITPDQLLRDEVELFPETPADTSDPLDGNDSS